MRKKIEELRNREEGFTLVELLAVIVILGIIVAIAIPTIGNVTERAQTGANEAEAELAIDAAQLFVVENKITPESLPDGVEESGGKIIIPVQTLIDKGYLEKLKKDSVLDGKSIELELSGVATDTNRNYKYTIPGLVD